MVHFKLSPNEEARILKEEQDKRRKLRIKQVREQDRINAAKIRQSVKNKRDELAANFVKDLEKKWDLEKDEKLRQLESIYDQNLENLGRGHKEADSENSERKEECRKSVELEERNRAAERHQTALNRQRQEMEERNSEERKHIVSRLMAIDMEKCRAQRIASLPKPKPDPIDDIEPLKSRPVKFTDHDAFTTSRYHIPDVLVEKENDGNEANAKNLAKTEGDKYKYNEEESKRIQNERAEKARLRHRNAVKKEHLKHHYDQLLHDLSDLQRADLNRRRLDLEKLPKQIFLAPHRRLEEKEELQMNMEKAFEDLYMAATDFGGDLNVALDAFHPQPSSSQSHDVTTEEDVTEVGDAGSSKDGTYTKEVIGREADFILPQQPPSVHAADHDNPENLAHSGQSLLAPAGQSHAAGGRQARLLQKFREKIEAQRNQVNKNLTTKPLQEKIDINQSAIGTTSLPGGNLFSSPHAANRHSVGKGHQSPASFEDGNSVASELSYVTPSPADSILANELSSATNLFPNASGIVPMPSNELKKTSSSEIIDQSNGHLGGKNILYDFRQNRRPLDMRLGIENDRNIWNTYSFSVPLNVGPGVLCHSIHSDASSQVSTCAGSLQNTNNNNSHYASPVKQAYHLSNLVDRQMTSMAVGPDPCHDKIHSDSVHSTDNESQSLWSYHSEKRSEDDRSSRSEAVKSSSHDLEDLQQLNKGVVDQTLEQLSDQSYCDHTLTEDFEKEITFPGGKTILNSQSFRKQVSSPILPTEKSLTLSARSEPLDRCSLTSSSADELTLCDGDGSVRAGLITFAGNVYHEWWPLSEDQSLGKLSSVNSIPYAELEQKRNSNDFKHERNSIQEISPCRSNDRSMMEKVPVDNVLASSASFSSELLAYSEESVKAGYFSFQGPLAIRAIHTVPTQVQLTDCITAWDEDGVFPDLDLCLPNNLQQFLLPSMQSTMIEEDLKESGAIQPCLVPNSVVELSQYTISQSLNDRISSAEVSLPSLKSSVVDDSCLHPNLFGNVDTPISFAIGQTSKGHTGESVQRPNSRILSGLVLNGLMQSRHHQPELCSKVPPSGAMDRAVRPENLDQQFLQMFSRLTEFNDIGSQMRCKTVSKSEDFQESRIEKVGDSVNTQSRWGEILEAYRAQETDAIVSMYDASKYVPTASDEFDQVKSRRDLSRDPVISCERHDVGNKAVQEMPGSHPSVLGVEDCEHGILDEPELTLVSADSTLLSSRGQISVSSSPQKILKSLSLLSFEHHELSATNSSSASSAERFRQKNSACSASNAKSDVVRRGKTVTFNNVQDHLPSVSNASITETEHPADATNASCIETKEAFSDHSKEQDGAVSLQAAFFARKKDFIKNSKQRIEDAKEKARNDQLIEKHSAARQNLTKTISDFIKTRAVNGKSACQPGHDIGNVVEMDSKDRKLTEKEMKNRTARLYSQLEEVKLKKEEEDRKNFYARNREKRKVFERKHNQMKKKQSSSQ